MAIMKLAVLLSIACLACTALNVQASNPAIPGLDEGLGQGYDVVLEMFRMPLFGPWNFADGATYTNPYNTKVYGVPDEMFLTELEKDSVVKETLFYNEWHEYRETITTNYGLDIGLGYGGQDLGKFAFKHSEGEVSGFLSNMTHQFAMEDRYMGLFQLDIWPDVQPNAHFGHMLEALPNTVVTSDDKESFRRFISYVGTHYLATAQFGGFVNITSVFDKSLLNTYDAKWVDNQIGLEITWEEINIGIDVGRNKSTDKVDGDYIEHSYSVIDYIGGLPILESGAYANWLESVWNHPGIMPKFQIMRPITELVVGNDVLKATLAEQVVAYITSFPPSDDTAATSGISGPVQSLL